MDNRTHELNMQELVDGLHDAGINAIRFGRSGVVCSLSNGNYIMHLSLSSYGPEFAKQFERDRLKALAARYEGWEKAALEQANKAELRAKRHHEEARHFRAMLEQLD